jgi:hypothetical protein
VERGRVVELGRGGSFDVGEVREDFMALSGGAREEIVGRLGLGVDVVERLCEGRLEDGEV